jgi:hypothetical protein
MRYPSMILAGLATLALAAGCAKQGPHATGQDIEAAKQEADKEVTQARVEAAKDVKSAVKTAGAHSNDVARAKAMADYDVAMAKAEGDHKVETERCLTLQASMVQACEDQANTEFETAKSEAKVTRVARQP